MAKIVAKAYGEALFELAMEKQNPESFLEEAKGILQILEENPEFDKLMTHPKISKLEKEGYEELVGNVFEGRVSREMTGFLKLIVNKERYGEVKNIIRYFAERLQEERGIGTAFVTTAVELSEDQKKAVRDKLLSTTSYKVMEMDYASIGRGILRQFVDYVEDANEQALVGLPERNGKT